MKRYNTLSTINSSLSLKIYRDNSISVVSYLFTDFHNVTHFIRYSVKMYETEEATSSFDSSV
jgi:hypothetical protein